MWREGSEHRVQSVVQLELEGSKKGDDGKGQWCVEHSTKEIQSTQKDFVSALSPSH